MNYFKYKFRPFYNIGMFITQFSLHKIKKQHKQDSLTMLGDVRP